MKVDPKNDLTSLTELAKKLYLDPYHVHRVAAKTEAVAIFRLDGVYYFDADNCKIVIDALEAVGVLKWDEFDSHQEAERQAMLARLDAHDAEIPSDPNNQPE